MYFKSHNLTTEELNVRTIDYIDIVTESLPEHKYKESEDPKKIKVVKTNPHRGPLDENWQKESAQKNIPVMCSYKIVKTKFEVWGFQTRVENWTQRVTKKFKK